MSTTMYLESLSRRPWDEMRVALPKGMCWYWADQGGAQLGPLTSDPPMTTHLWGWERGGGRWARLRVDRGEALGALLHRGAEGEGWVPVAVSQSRSGGRGAREHSMIDGPGAEENLRGVDMTIYYLTGERSLHFAEIDPDKGWSVR